MRARRIAGFVPVKTTEFLSALAAIRQARLNETDICLNSLLAMLGLFSKDSYFVNLEGARTEIFSLLLRSLFIIFDQKYPVEF